MTERILVAGYYGHGNVGDEAILEATVGAFRDARPGLELCVASATPDATSERHAVDTVSDRDLAALRGAIEKSDLVVLGGGGLFQDYWVTAREDLLTDRQSGFLYYASIPLLAALLERPCALFAVGVGPLRTAWGQEATRSAFALSQSVTVRDRASLLELERLDPDLGNRATVTFDPAILAPRSTGGSTPHPAIAEGNGPLLGLALRHWSFTAAMSEWPRELAAALDGWRERTGGRLLFVPFQHNPERPAEDDVAVARQVRELLRDPSSATVLEEPLDVVSTRRILAACDQVLAMRYHAALFALKERRPVAAMCYDPKVRVLMEEAGLGDSAREPEEWTSRELGQCLRQLGTNPGSVDEATLERWRRLALDSVREALDTLDRGLVPTEQSLREVRRFCLERSQLADDYRRRLDAAEEEVGRLVYALEQTTARADQLDEAHRRLSHEYQQIHDQLVELRSSLPVRLGTLYWRALSSLAPEGSLRRRAYLRLRRRGGS